MTFERSSRLVSLALVTLLAVSSANAMPSSEDTWLRVETAHFILVGNADEARIVAIGENLESMREVLAHTTEGLEFTSPLPTTIYVFKDWDSMTPYNLGADGRAQELDGYFLRTEDANFVAINASSAALPYAVIYHEYLHYLLENSVSAIPLWLNEGLAEFYSTFQLDESGAVFGLPMQAHLLWLSSHPWMSLDALFKIDTASEEYHEGERQSTYYAASWALTHYLLTNPARRDRFGLLLARLERGTPSAEALESTYETELLVLEKEAQKHALSGAMKFHRVALEGDIVVRGTRIEPMTRKEVLVRLGDLLSHQIPTQADASEEHLLAALALDGAYLEAQVSLAALRILQQRFDDAVTLTSQVLSVDADRTRAYVLRGAARLERAIAAIIAAPDEFTAQRPEMERARADFRRALDIEPDLIWALDGLGTTYLFETENLEEGLSALARAFQRRPARTETLVRLISVTANSGNVEGAQTLLTRVLRPRGDADSTRLAEEAVVRVRMERAVQLLMANEVDQALTLLRDILEDTTSPEVRSNVATTLARIETEYRAELLRREAIAAGAAGDKERAEELMRQAGEVYGHGELAESESSRFEAAARMAENGEYDVALEIYDGIATTAKQPALRTLAAENAAKVRKIKARDRQVDQYNAAVQALNDGDPERARQLLVEFLETELDEDLRVRAEELLRDARRRLERSGSER